MTVFLITDVWAGCRAGVRERMVGNLLTRFTFLDALASLESMMSVIVSLTENNWVTDRKFSLLQDVM